MRSAANPAHSASSSAIASNMPASCCASGRATTRARGARAPRTSPLAASSADRLAHRRARDLEAAREPGLVERGAGRQLAAHDLVGELQTQFLSQRLAVAAERRMPSGVWR